MTLSPRLITAVLAGALLIGTAACGADTPTAASPPTPPAATAPSVASSPSQAVWENGTYKVGEQITAGEYKTDGATTQCYWNRLKDTSGDSSAMIARDIFSGPSRFTAEASDGYIKLGGPCKWTRA
jgi:hypothetical protein